MPRGNLDDLRALVAVARERSFTKAAAKLGISQSALTQTIRLLEVGLGGDMQNRIELPSERPLRRILADRGAPHDQAITAQQRPSGPSPRAR